MKTPMYTKMRDLVRANGMEQRALARKMGISEGRLSLMLNGKRRISVDDFLDFCEAVGVEPKTLYES